MTEEMKNEKPISAEIFDRVMSDMFKVIDMGFIEDLEGYYNGGVTVDDIYKKYVDNNKTEQEKKEVTLEDIYGGILSIQNENSEIKNRIENLEKDVVKKDVVKKDKVIEGKSYYRDPNSDKLFKIQTATTKSSIKPQKNKVNPLRNIILENGTKLVLDLSGLMEVIDKIEGDYDEKKKISVRKS